MKLKILLLVMALAFLSRCATYKQLKPDPELSPAEQGYIELKDDDDDFELKKDKKYFMAFPTPPEANFYLVLDIRDKAIINTYLTDTFDDGKGRIVEIPDESNEPDKTSVYPVATDIPQYFWVIDLVKNDVLLNMDYRYVPQWRYKFETQYDAIKQSVILNSIDQSAYLGIGGSFDIDNFDYNSEITGIKTKSGELEKARQTLLEIESIFPPEILNSKDEAYLNYLELKQQIEEELKFHQKYSSTLHVLKLETESRGQTGKFDNALPEFLTFFEADYNHDTTVLSTIKDLLGGRLVEITPFYTKQLQAKNDANRIDIRLKDAKQLYKFTGKIPEQDFLDLNAFVNTYNEKVDGVWTTKKKLDEISKIVRTQKNMPGNTFFSTYLSQLSRLENSLPKPMGRVYGPLYNADCVRRLNIEINTVQQRIRKLLSQYREADRLIPQLNTYKEHKDYQAMRRLIKQNGRLAFLPGLYKNLDEMSIHEQTNKIKSAFRNQNWAMAEGLLQDLHLDRDFLDYKSIAPAKNKLVKFYEDSLYLKVDNISRQRATQFMNENLATIDKVELLYDNLAFLPVHELTFTSGDQASLQKKVKALSEHMRQIREVTFPETAIKQLYTGFTADLSSEGVHKGRAIVAHGKNYKGKDSATWRRIVECDPYSAKKLSKLKDYRKIYVLPTTTNTGSSNEYLLRMNIQIPSEAKFPLYDINVKLPKSIAGNASNAQWYDVIKINGDVIKNEGRYTIIAPMSSNNYECQITPVRVNKSGDNVFEIKFKTSSFQVYEVSIMAQEPIIRKN